MKSQMTHLRAMQEDREPNDSLDNRAFKATTVAVFAQIAVALVVAITVGAIVESDSGITAAHDFPAGDPAAAAASAAVQSADSSSVSR